MKNDNKVEIKDFWGNDVRVINDEFVILKDVFASLGRLRADGQIESTDRRKLNEFLECIGKTCAGENLTIDFEKKKGKGNKSNGSIQNVDCIKLETVPIVLTQFKPSVSKAKPEESKKKLKCWCEFMQFVDKLLTELEVHKYIVVDKEQYKDEIERLADSDGKPMVANNQVNTIMAKLIGVYPDIKAIKKDELKTYQDQTTIDLLQVREYVLNKFVNAFEVNGSHKESGEFALRMAKKKYNIG